MHHDSAFGTLIETAVQVHTGRHLTVWIDPPPVNWELAGLVPPQESEIAARFALRDGALTRIAAGP